MNKTFKSIWNEALGAWVAASELDRARGKRVASSRGTPERDIEGAAAVRAGATSAPSLRRLAMLMASAYLALFHAGAHAQYNPDGGTATGGVSSIAIGVGSSAAQTNSTALGNLSTAQGVSATALGPGRMRWATLRRPSASMRRRPASTARRWACRRSVRAITRFPSATCRAQRKAGRWRWAAVRPRPVCRPSGPGNNALASGQYAAALGLGRAPPARKASRWAMHRMRT